MIIRDYWLSNVVKDYEFMDEVGKYRKQFEEGSITINSWNRKVFVYVANNTIKPDMLKELINMGQYVEFEEGEE